MKLLPADALRAWTTARSIGRSLEFPNSRDLTFRSTDATWYRFRVAGQPAPEALTATIVTTAAAGHGGYLFPPYNDGRWRDPLNASPVDLAGLGFDPAASQAADLAGALELDPTETPLAIRAMTQALAAGSLWSLCFLPEHGQMILATDEDGDLIGSFPHENARQAFLAALGCAGWMEPTDPDPRVSETDPWLTL